MQPEHAIGTIMAVAMQPILPRLSMPSRIIRAFLIEEQKIVKKVGACLLHQAIIVVPALDVHHLPRSYERALLGIAWESHALEVSGEHILG